MNVYGKPSFIVDCFLILQELWEFFLNKILLTKLKSFSFLICFLFVSWSKAISSIQLNELVVLLAVGSTSSNTHLFRSYRRREPIMQFPVMTLGGSTVIGELCKPLGV